MMNYMSVDTEGTKNKLKVHFRVLTAPLISQWDMLDAAKDLFSQYNIEIKLKSNFSLENECPPEYKEREIRYQCIIGDPLSNQEKELYAYARDYENIIVKDLEFVCYFIDSCYFKK